MKKRKYKHIDKIERKEIALLLSKGYSFRDIGKALGRSPNSISREIRENSVLGSYYSEKANHKAYVKRKYSKYQGMKVVDNPALWGYIKEKIREDWSPEMISGRIRKIDNHLRSISPKGIYKFVFSVYGRNLERFLAYKGRKRKPKTARKVLGLKERMFIDQRPKIVDQRRRFGDWEGDFIVSGKEGKGVLLVFYERKSRYVLLKKLLSRKIEEVHRAIYEITGGVFMNTLTLDNDIVFRKHKELSEILETPIYFCHPYHSWEKGGVENTNKLIRRYIPKGGDISQYSNQYIRMIEDKLNNRPRKCLNYKTPNEVMKENRQFKEEIKYTLSDILKVDKTKNLKCPT
jgi:IS30 family transposase